jgi:hypothetical protein
MAALRGDISFRYLKQFFLVLVSDWYISKNLLLKPLSQMKQNLVGSIYGKSSI